LWGVDRSTVTFPAGVVFRAFTLFAGFSLYTVAAARKGYRQTPIG
jgi:hypothetical protein